MSNDTEYSQLLRQALALTSEALALLDRANASQIAAHLDLVVVMLGKTANGEQANPLVHTAKSLENG